MSRWKREEKPAWVVALEQEAARTSQARAARLIGYSPPVVNAVIRGLYAGAWDRVELAVRGKLMKGRIDCPELGSIPAHKCLEHQRNAHRKNLANPTRVMMFRACQVCPRFTKESK